MSYNILAINPGHNGSCALVVDGEVVFYSEEERFSRLKYDGNPFKSMLAVLLNQKIDEVVIGGTNPQLPQLPWTNEDPYSALVRKFNPNVKVTILGHLHHLGHASSTFYGSGFETAVAIIVDGAGFVDTYSSHAPEEMVPGRVYDTLDMKVFTADTATFSDVGFSIDRVIMTDIGFGYNPSSVTVTVSGINNARSSFIPILKFLNINICKRVIYFITYNLI